MRRPLALAGALLVSLALTAGCTNRATQDPPSSAATTPASQLPAAEELLKATATELRTVKTARFAITTEGQADSLGLSSAKGVITSDGDAEGSAQLDQAGVPLELSFVVKGDSLYVNGLTGGWQKLPLATAAAVYDPSALLSPDRGIANLVATTNGTTEGRETIDGVDTYRISGTLAGPALGTLVPGLAVDVKGTLWIGADRRLLHRASFGVPGQSGTVTVTFSEYDAPVTIRVP